jgi:Uma2 family endonuclease
MPVDALDYPHRSKRGEPVWELASFYPPQGDWSENEYLWLNTNRLVEYRDGMLEFLPMPSIEHQVIIGFLYNLLSQWAAQNGGMAYLAPMPLATIPKFYREPDVMFVADTSTVQLSDRRLDSADLVIEVVSEGADNRKRDFVDKHKEYAEAGIPEYWIVDPEERKVHVLTLKGRKYAQQAFVDFDTVAASARLKGFEARLSDAGNQAKPNK